MQRIWLAVVACSYKVIRILFQINPSDNCFKRRSSACTSTSSGSSNEVKNNLKNNDSLNQMNLKMIQCWYFWIILRSQKILILTYFHLFPTFIIPNNCQISFKDFKIFLYKTLISFSTHQSAINFQKIPYSTQKLLQSSILEIQWIYSKLFKMLNVFGPKLFVSCLRIFWIHSMDGSPAYWNEVSWKWCKMMDFCYFWRQLDEVVT